MNKKTILFVGSHLSKTKGTKGISEKISERLSEDFFIKLVSKKENKFLRLLDIVFVSLLGRYDIMHVDVFSNKGLIYARISAFIGRLRNKKIVLTLRGGMLYKRYIEKKRVLDKLFNKADVLQTPSLFLINFFEKYGYKIDYMPNFIDLDIFKYKWTVNNLDKHKLLWVRGFSEEYKPELAVKALKYILKYYPDSELTMIGPDKGNMSKIKKLVESLDLTSKVKFVGKVKNEELPAYYTTHSVFLNTTMYESFGVAVLEAAACGIPIVSTSVGEIPFLWKENKEILLSDFSSEKMGEQIKRIFDNENFAQQLSVNARKKSENYDWKLIKKKWINLFNKL